MITYNKVSENIRKELEDPKIKAYSIISFTFFTVLVLLFFAVRPVLLKVSSEYGDYTQLKAESQTLDQNLSNLAQAEETYDASIIGNTDTLQTALPATYETGPLFANMNAIAVVHGIAIDTIKFIKQGEDINSLNIKGFVVPQKADMGVLFFSISGSCKDFNNVAAFVSDLENYPRTFNILTVNVAASVDKSNNATARQFYINGYVYHILGVKQ